MSGERGPREERAVEDDNAARRARGGLEKSYLSGRRDGAVIGATNVTARSTTYPEEDAQTPARGWRTHRRRRREVRRLRRRRGGPSRHGRSRRLSVVRGRGTSHGHATSGGGGGAGGLDAARQGRRPDRYAESRHAVRRVRRARGVATPAVRYALVVSTHKTHNCRAVGRTRIAGSSKDCSLLVGRGHTSGAPRGASR